MNAKNLGYIWLICTLVFSFLECGHKTIDFNTTSDFEKASASQVGLWSSIAELKQIPMSGPAWEAVQTAANIDFSKPVINNNNSNDDVNCLAASIVYARTGDQLYKERVVKALEYNVVNGNPGFDSNGILTWCRNTGAYALAADMIGYRTPQLETWFRNMAETYRDPSNHNNTIEEIFYRRANNWGTQAFGTLCAVYGYLRDSLKLEAIRNYWVQMVKGPNPGATYGSDISWHADQNNLRLINPKGSVKDGLNIDGILPDDMRRNGPFSNPPPKSITSYHWEVLQGIISGARILERFDPKLSIWETGDKAILRAVTILEVDWRRDFNGEGSNWAASGDDAWMLPFIDAAYGTDFTKNAFDTSTLWSHGKNAGWAYVLHLE
jgi:hypothetical protein